MLNTQEPEIATQLFMDFAVKKQGVLASVVYMYNSSHAKEKQTKKAIQKAMEEVWTRIVFNVWRYVVD
jgi:hypothetical protein